MVKIRNPVTVIRDRVRLRNVKEEKDEKKYGIGLVGSAKSFWGRWEDPDPNLKDIERIYKEDGVVYAAVEKTVSQTTGVGFHTVIKIPKDETEDDAQTGKTVTRKATPREMEAKEIVDQWFEDADFDEKIQIINRDSLVGGNAYFEVLGYKYGVMSNVKILPYDLMRVDRKNTGKIEGYFEKRTGMDKIREPIHFESDQVIHFKFNPLSCSAYGQSMIKPVYSTISKLNEIDSDYIKIIRRYASPKILWVLPPNTSDEDKRKFEDSIQNMPVNKDPVVRAQTGEDGLKWDILNIDPRGRFESLYDMLQQKVQTGLQTPLMSYLRNATEASATKMEDDFKDQCMAFQRYMKRKVENQIIRRVLDQHNYGDVKTVRIEWGKEKSGVEEIKVSDVAMLCDQKTGPVLSPYQGRELLRAIGVPVEEEAEEDLPEEPEPVNIPVGKNDPNLDPRRIISPMLQQRIETIVKEYLENNGSSSSKVKPRSKPKGNRTT